MQFAEGPLCAWHQVGTQHVLIISVNQYSNSVKMGIITLICQMMKQELKLLI